MKKLFGLITGLMMLISGFSQAPATTAAKPVVKAGGSTQGILIGMNQAPMKLALLKKASLPVLNTRGAFVQRITPTSGSAPSGGLPAAGGTSISRSRIADAKTAGAVTRSREGARYCTSEPVSEKSGDYTKIVLGNQIDKIYPGAIYTDNAVVDGSYNAPAGIQPKPYEIAISLFSAASSASTIVQVQPTLGNVNDGIAELMRRQSNVLNAGMVSVEAEYMYSIEQLGFFLQSGFHGFGVDLNTEFGTTAVTRKNVIFVKLHQVYFSVSLNRPNGAGLVTNAVSSLPSSLVYVNKVNYGRIGIIRIESNYTKEQVKSALEFTFNAAGTTTSASTRLTHQQVLSTSNIDGFFFGGDAADVISISSATALADFNSYVKNGLRLNPNVAPVPVSYELKYLNDNASAAINSTTSYTQRTCETAKALSITLNGISIEDVHSGDCSYAWGTVDLEVWELTNGVKSKMIMPIENGVQLTQSPGKGTAIWNVPDGRNPQRSVINYASVRANQDIDINNVNKTWKYDLDPAKVAAGEIMILTKCNINTNHKDNDFASLGFHGMSRVETKTFSLAEVLIKNSERTTKGKYGSMKAGPFSSNSNRAHSFRAHFTVTADN
jgi:hypothetical protein